MKWNIRSKIKLVTGIIFLSFFLIGMAVFLNIKRLEGTTEWMEHSHQTIHFLQQAYVHLKEAQASYADFLLTQKDNYARSCQAQLGAIEKDLKKADELIDDSSLLQKDLEELQALFGQKTASLQAGLAYAKAGRSDLALGGIDSEGEKKSNRAIKDMVDRMSGMQAWLLKTRKTLEETHTQKNIRFIGTSALLTILICGLAVFFVTRYINERQGMLNLLKSSEERYRFLAENAAEAFVTTDGAGKILDVNPSSEVMYGYSKSELEGKPLTLLMPSRFTEEHGEGAFKRFLELTDPKIGISSMELYSRRKDGSEFPVEVSVSAWETREGVFYTTITRDVTERKFFMKTLLKNEHRLFQFLEAVPVGILVRDKLGIPYYANQAARKLLGNDVMKDSKPEKISEVYRIYLEGTDQYYPAAKSPILRALKGEKATVNDAEIRQPGKTVPVQIWGAPILDENEDIKYALTAIVDLTHQKEITESLRSREEFFRNLFEEGPIGMVLSFPDTTYANVNRAFADMLGYTKDELIGRPFTEFVHPEDAAVEEGLSKRLFDKTIPKYQLEKRYLTKDKRTLWTKLSASVIRDSNGEPLFRLAIVENINDQKQTETALKENQERFRAVAESANDAIVSADSEGKMIYFNKAAEVIFGHPKPEALGRPLTLLMPERLHKQHLLDLHHFLATGESAIVGRTVEMAGRKKDGTEFAMELSLSSWQTAHGTFFTYIMRNITERKQIDDMKRDLISVVSHQLKTPVAEINGYIENMLEGLAGELSGKQREYLSDMKEIGMENYRLISDLLSLSKIERGVITVDPQPIPLVQIVDLSIRDYASLAQRKGLSLEVKNAQESTVVMADQDKTVETLRNIINNAIKCTDKGGITIQTRTEDGFGLVEVTDTGIGMGPETLKRLFTKERVMGAEAARAGAGLGLYIAKSFMTLQKGDISVVSTLGKGSTFQVKVPIADKESA